LGYDKILELERESIVVTFWRTRFGIGYGLIARQTA